MREIRHRLIRRHFIEKVVQFSVVAFHVLLVQQRMLLVQRDEQQGQRYVTFVLLEQTAAYPVDQRRLVPDVEMSQTERLLHFRLALRRGQAGEHVERQILTSVPQELVHHRNHVLVAAEGKLVLHHYLRRTLAVVTVVFLHF